MAAESGSQMLTLRQPSVGACSTFIVEDSTMPGTTTPNPFFGSYQPFPRIGSYGAGATFDSWRASRCAARTRGRDAGRAGAG